MAAAIYPPRRRKWMLTAPTAPIHLTAHQILTLAVAPTVTPAVDQIATVVVVAVATAAAVDRGLAAIKFHS